MVRGECVAVPVHSTNAVSVPIGDQAKVCRMFFKGCSAAAVILLDGFWGYAAKVRVVISIKSPYFAVRVFKDLIEAPCPHAKKGFVGKV